jgi:hypothetical protein
LGDLSGLLALFGALVYMLGILALWFPIFRNYTHDLAGSWYAVSIIPKTTVIGQGLIRLFIPVTIYAALIAIALSADYVARLQGTPWKIALRTIALLIAYFFPVAWIVTLDFVGNEQFALWEYAVVLISPVPIIVAALWTRKLVHNPVDHEGRRRLVIKAVVVVLVSSFVASFLAFGVIPHRPSVPRVDLTGSHSVEEGRLLTHSEGYWYIIEPDGEVFAVPDDEGRTAEVHPMGF